MMTQLVNYVWGRGVGEMDNTMVSSSEKKPLGSCISLKDDMASLQRVVGKHLTFSLERLGCAVPSVANCLPDSTFRSQQTIHYLERYFG